MSAGPDRRRRRAVSAITRSGEVGGVVAALALVVSGCASHDALGLAQKACAKVDGALALYARSQSEGSSPQAASDAATSVVQLHAALPVAAVAAGESPMWQPLMTTLTEAGRVPEQYLVHALTVQCADAQASGNANEGP